MAFIENIISPLQQFAHFATQGGFHRFNPPPDNITVTDGITGIILHREGPFQLELFIVPGDKANIPLHTHPGVDSIEIQFAGGEGCIFISEGIRYNFDRPLTTIFVPEYALHGSEGAEALSFMSAQHWKHGDARRSIIESWTGDMLGKDHLYLLKGE